jgi:hypothetical protein
VQALGRLHHADKFDPLAGTAHRNNVRVLSFDRSLLSLPGIGIHVKNVGIHRLNGDLFDEFVMRYGRLAYCFAHGPVSIFTRVGFEMFSMLAY